jgi:hypothetical protein
MRDKGTVVAFRVAGSAQLRELRSAAAAQGETVSQFVRKSVGERLVRIGQADRV